MATRKVTIEGTLDWAKVFEHNRDKASFHEETDGAYKITVTMDKDNLKKLKDAGCSRSEKNVDGGFQITFDRPHKGREDWMGGPPVVADITGKPWSLEDKGVIGNGSKGLVQLSVFDSKPRNGTRLEGVQVTEHVVYETEKSNTTMFQDLSKSSEVPSSQESQDSIPY